MSRFINIHKNQPGVLNAINNLLASRGLNIAGQYLQTSAEVGYVVIDIDSVDLKQSEQILAELKKVDGTIKARLLF